MPTTAIHFYRRKIHFRCLFVSMFVFILGFSFSFGLSGLVGSSEAWAKKRGRVIRFEDELIKGDRAQPNFLSLFRGDQLEEGSLLKLRENFILEMRRTSGILYRKVGVKEGE